MIYIFSSVLCYFSVKYLIFVKDLGKTDNLSVL